ncbi:MAG: hypothetical protein LBO09_09235 [Candidatus Peribacteria bacterium]|jgi:hypothetical protein|nr:hypothetical protein [Candidatus Peribacteria bacterium]
MEKFTTVKEALAYLQSEFADDTTIDLEMLGHLFQTQLMERIPEILKPAEVAPFEALLGESGDFKEADLKKIVSGYEELLADLVSEVLTQYLLGELTT